jgi:hypothetical protein
MEVVKRKRDALEKKAQREQAMGVTEDGMNSGISTTESDSLDTQPSHDTVVDVEPVLHVLHTRKASWRPVSLPLRSGRNPKLPTRFQ